MRFMRPIRIEVRDEETERWVEHMPIVHARVNKARGSGYENLDAGAIRYKRILTFEVRYSKPIRDIAYNTQLFRIIYEGQTFDIIDYDDFQERHRTVTLTGAIYE